MTMTFKVVSIESANRFVDGVERVTLQVQEADGIARDIRIPNKDGWELEDEFTVDVRPGDKPSVAELLAKAIVDRACADATP